MITLGGIGTIVSVLMVCVVLVWVVLPLFAGGEVSGRTEVQVAATSGDVVRVGEDEYRTIGFSIDRQGHLRSFLLDDGTTIVETPLSSLGPASAVSFSPGSNEFGLGFADGRVVLGRLEFTTSYLDAKDLPEDLRTLPEGKSRPHGQGVLQRTSIGQYRQQALQVVTDDPVDLGVGGPIRLFDQTTTSSGRLAAAMDDEGRLFVRRFQVEYDMLEDEETTVVVGGALDVASVEQEKTGNWSLPDHLALSSLGDTVYLIWNSGRLLRVDARDVEKPVLAESLSLFPGEKGRRVTAFAPLLGRSSLLVGDDLGRLGVWFRTKPSGAPNPDGIVMRRGHLIAGRDAALTAIASSGRSRVVALGFDDGGIRIVHVTGEGVIADIPPPGDAGPALAVALAPKEDGLLALYPRKAASWALDVGYPEASFKAYFGKVWYEEHVKPEYVWQSSSGTDEFEPKLSLVPLIFGTVKATIYSLLFGVPLALLAAVFTSEFMHPKWKRRIKPTLELMASLPSVVLGFIAGLVISPFLEKHVPQALVAVYLIPFFFLLGSQLWQGLSPRWSSRLGVLRGVFLVFAVALGVQAAGVVGPFAERVFFAGDLRLWLDGQGGDATGGWLLMVLPACVLAAWAVVALPFRRTWERWTGLGSRGRAAALEVVRFLAGSGLAVGLAWGVAVLLTAAGFDPRGSVLGTYVQRNALVVGFAMGFAIIPIIYTLADDALSSVPQHLRAASLGCGATPWQTASRVVIPTAMSGIFSAVMIGLGRAVGETMIVLMAAGNTPIMDWNVFNGFRTLSANIAEELPEAVKDSTHYRTLFLAALVLFVMTLVLNTVAEVVRQRFRRRATRL